MILTSIPSPGESVWHLGPLPLRAYALCIIAGIVVAIWLGEKRWVARGGAPGTVTDIAIWAVPFGVVGGRLYHVVTDYQLFFGAGRDPWKVFEIWGGGLGIWGAIALGAVGGWIGCRRKGVPLPAMADALAPGILLAQAIGRWGNWFNQELFGKPTDLPWGLEIEPGLRPDDFQAADTFHPIFLYESLWCVAVALALMWADRRFTLGHGRVFALYVAGYTVGRAYFETLRIDPANEILGLRVNLWVSGLVFLGAVAYVVVSSRRKPGREEPEALSGFYEEPDPFDDEPRPDADEAPPERAPEALDADEPRPDADESPPAEDSAAEGRTTGDAVHRSTATDDLGADGAVADDLLVDEPGEKRP